jgi:multimeric flavodoxin WrbA
MKALGIVGSPRKGGNTELYVTYALKTIADEGIQTEMVLLAGKNIRSCTACNACRKEEKCAIDDDLMPIYLKMKEADAIIIGTPVYSQGATGLVRSFMERASYIAIGNKRPFTGKVGGPLVVTRRTAMSLTLAQMLLWFAQHRFFIPGAMGTAFGTQKGDVLKDEEGMTHAHEFGQGVAFLLKKLNT